MRRNGYAIQPKLGNCSSISILMRNFLNEAWPFHGALVKIVLKNQKEATLLIIGDTGAGKPETLEAFRILGDEYLTEMKIIADDMGSLKIGASGEIVGYGTEIGAFVRLKKFYMFPAIRQLLPATLKVFMKKDMKLI